MQVCMNTHRFVYVYMCIGICVNSTDIECGPVQFTWHAICVKYHYVNDTFLNKLTKWYQ